MAHFKVQPIPPTARLARDTNNSVTSPEWDYGLRQHYALIQNDTNSDALTHSDTK